MASRRTRIKGIANIPQRKKINQENNTDAEDTSIVSSDKDAVDAIKVLIKQENSIDGSSQTENKQTISSVSLIKHVSSIKGDYIEEHSEKPVNSLINNINLADCPKAVKTENGNNTSNLADTGSCIKKENLADTSDTGKIEEPKQTNSIAARRKFLKPGINLKAIKKRPTGHEPSENIPAEGSDLSLDDINKVISNRNEANSTERANKVVLISEIRIPSNETGSNCIVENSSKDISKEVNGGDSYQGSLLSEVTLNETYLSMNDFPALNSSVTTTSANIKKVIPEVYSASDSEYPAPPPSPSKINRSRIKAIPRLSQRKTSCSASESEDETRKYGRIRNNSVCSVVSTSCLEPPTPTSETVRPKEEVQIVPRKINRTEQSRKLAEARREFHKRFGDNNPDKQKLKMIDLIFYNPTSNPMSRKITKPEPENDTKTEKEGDENMDNPPEVDVNEKNEPESNTDNSLPVPQIKIGPSGEIILDEQSLIVENAEVARQKEQIQNSQIVNGDFDTGYGIYKRAPRSQPWNQKETLRFYKALNLVGTDFTIMTQLFPKRNRRELKIKFKKEEKINRQLIDKAIMQPCNYNFADLKREIEIEEEEDAALQKLKEEETKKFQMDKLEKKRKEKAARNSASLSDDISKTSDPITDISSLPPKKRLKSLQKTIKTKPQRKRTKQKSLNIKNVLEDDSDADISDMETQSESEEEETIPFLKPTRSGRMPKSTTRYTTIIDQEPNYSYHNIKETTPDTLPFKQPYNMLRSLFPEVDKSQKPNTAIRNRRSSSVSSIESNSEKLVPGSVVIMTEDDSDGKQNYKVFMVTPERKLAPLDLESDIVARLIKERHNEDESEFVLPSIPEENLTIPATDPILTSEPRQTEIVLINYPDAV